MEKIEEYAQIIVSVLEEYQSIKPFNESIEKLVLVDSANHHYQLIYSGWQDKQFIHFIVFHFQIKPDGKVWLLVNQTDIKIAEELVERGVPKSDIVLGFQPPQYRQFTEYAAA